MATANTKKKETTINDVMDVIKNENPNSNKKVLCILSKVDNEPVPILLSENCIRFYQWLKENDYIDYETEITYFNVLNERAMEF